MNEDLRGRLEQHADLLDQLGNSKVTGHIQPDTAKQIAQDIRDSLTEDATEAEQVVSECTRRLPFELVSAVNARDDKYHMDRPGISGQYIQSICGPGRVHLELDAAGNITRMWYPEEPGLIQRTIPAEHLTEEWCVITPEMRDAKGVRWGEEISVLLESGEKVDPDHPGYCTLTAKWHRKPATKIEYIPPPRHVWYPRDT